MARSGSQSSYALRQLKFPSSNINKLDKPVAVSTGTFVMNSVIHQCDSCWLKSHPSTHRNLTTSKKGAKGSVVVFISFLSHLKSQLSRGWLF